MENIQNINPFVYKNYDSKAAIRKRNISFSGNEKTDNVPKYKDPSTGSIVGGFLVGSMANSAIVATQTPFAEHVMEKMRNISRGLNAEEAAQVESAISRTLSDSGLKDKGVEIIKASLDNATDIYKIMENEVNNNFLLKSLPQKIKQFVVENRLANPIIAGFNACYTFVSKKILLPEKALQLAGFHEAGHAMNANLSMFGKILQKCRYSTALAAPISLIALLKTKKAPDEKPKNSLDKATDFIKDNAGILTSITFLPLLLEEGLATLKGNKYAKKLLSPELAKKVVKSNAYGFSTYALMAILSGIGIFAGTKIKDSIAKKQPAVDNETNLQNAKLVRVS